MKRKLEGKWEMPGGMEHCPLTLLFPQNTGRRGPSQCVRSRGRPSFMYSTNEALNAPIREGSNTPVRTRRRPWQNRGVKFDVLSDKTK